MWVVLIPVFLLSALVVLFVNYVGITHVIYLGEPDISFMTFFGNLFGLQTIFLNQFAANYPLWSLANETWYYVSFPLVVLLFLPVSVKLYKLASVLLLVLMFLYLPKKILVFSIVWLLGALVSRIKLDVPRCVSLFLLLIALIVMTYGRYKNIHNNIYMVFAYVMPLLLFLSSMQVTKFKWMQGNTIVNKTVEYFSNISFSLYVIHVPFIYLALAVYISITGNAYMDPHSVIDAGIFISMVTVTVLLTYLFYRLFETKHLMIRSYLKSKLLCKKQETVPVTF